MTTTPFHEYHQFIAHARAVLDYATAEDYQRSNLIPIVKALRATHGLSLRQGKAVAEIMIDAAQELRPDTRVQYWITVNTIRGSTPVEIMTMADREQDTQKAAFLRAMARAKWDKVTAFEMELDAEAGTESEVRDEREK